VAKSERLYSAEEGAFATRLTLSSFRTKVSKLGIKGLKHAGNDKKVYFTRAQLQDIYDNKSSKTAKMLKALQDKNEKAEKAPARKAAMKAKVKQ
jgi:hypothetical protein